MQDMKQLHLMNQIILTSPRLIASKVNADAKLTNLPGNKS